MRRLNSSDSTRILRLLDYTTHPRDIADPWYTDNFDITYDDVLEGCTAFLNYIKKEHNI